MLTSIINSRIMRGIEQRLPEQQYGFRHGRNTHQAITILTDKISDSLSRREPLYPVYVDFRKAFPSVDRALLIPKLAEIGVRGRILGLIASCLQYNVLAITDGLRQTDDITQHRGLPEGDTLAPTEYLIFAKDLADQLSTVATVEFLMFLMFADDLVIYSPRIEELQAALDTLANWCRTNKISVNMKKTKAMKFRRGGKLSSTDVLTFNGSNLEFTNEYTYLGITLQTTMRSFAKHVIEKKRKALSAIAALKYLQLTSLKTAKKVFQSKIRPIIEYSLKGIAKYLSTANLKEIDRVKAAFFKKALGLHNSASSTFAIALAKERHYVEDLMDHGYNFAPDVIRDYKKDIDDRLWTALAERYTDGPAFQSEDWMQHGRKDRHLTVRTTYHGFHHLL